MHAVACLITYAVCSYPRPFVHYCACFFLLFELSTPFMHLRTPPKLLPALGSGWLHRGPAKRHLAREVARTSVVVRTGHFCILLKRTDSLLFQASNVRARAPPSSPTTDRGVSDVAGGCGLA